MPPSVAEALSEGRTSCWILEIVRDDELAAESDVGNASTRASPPCRHCGGATAAATPGVCSRALTTSRVAPGPAFSTRTMYGFMTPGEISALTSAWRPLIASPFPG